MVRKAKVNMESLLAGMTRFGPVPSRYPAMLSTPACAQAIAVAAVKMTAGRSEAKATAGWTFLPLICRV